MLQVFQFESNEVTFRSEDGPTMVNATQMAKPFDKQPKHWLQNQSTGAFLTELSEVRNLTSVDLVQVIHGEGGGTWMHEDVALEFSRWLSPRFAIWCNDRIKELMKTGSTSTAPMSIEDMIIASAQSMKEVKAQMTALESKVNLIEAQTKTRPDYFAISGYAALRKVEAGVKRAAHLGRLASALCRERGIITEVTHDPRFGVVNTYPESILKEVFEMQLTH